MLTHSMPSSRVTSIEETSGRARARWAAVLNRVIREVPPQRDSGETTRTDGRGVPRGKLEVTATSGRALGYPGHSGEAGVVDRAGVREVTEQDPGGTLALSSSGTGPVDGITGSDGSWLLCGNWVVRSRGRGPLRRLWCHPGQSHRAGTPVVAGAMRTRGLTLRGGKWQMGSPAPHPAVSPPFPSRQESGSKCWSHLLDSRMREERPPDSSVKAFSREPISLWGVGPGSREPISLWEVGPGSRSQG